MDGGLEPTGDGPNQLSIGSFFSLSDPNDLGNSLSDPSLQNYDKVVLTLSGLPDAAAYKPAGFTGDPIGIGNSINSSGLSSTGASDVYNLNTVTGISDLKGLFLNLSPDFSGQMDLTLFMTAQSADKYASLQHLFLLKWQLWLIRQILLLHLVQMVQKMV